MTRYNNPYSGLSDGIQQGLRSWAQADVAKSEHGVRMAQMQLDKQQRDEDYAVRLRQLANQDKQVLIAQAGEEREAYKHRIEQAQRAKSQFESNFSMIQTDDGKIDWKNPNAQKVINDTNFMLKNDPYAVQTMRDLLGVRTGDKDTLQLELMPDGSGLAAVTSSSKDPSLSGVLTANASKDPDDPVLNVSGDDVRQLINITSKAELLGAPPAVTAYFLHKNYGLGGNGEMNVSPEVEQQAQVLEQEIFADAQTDNRGITPENIRPVQDQPAALSTGSSYTDEGVQQGRAFRQKLSEGIDSFTNSITSKRENDLSGLRESNAAADGPRANMERLTGAVRGFMGGNEETPTNPNTTGTKEENVNTQTLDDYAPRNPQRVQAPKDLSSEGIQAAFSELQKGSFKVAARESQAVKNALLNKANSESRRTELMGRYLMMQSLKAPDQGGMSPQSAAMLFETGRMRADEYYKLAMTQPSEAGLMAQWAAKGGVKATRSKEDQDKTIEFVEKTNRTLNEIGGKYKLPNGDDIPTHVMGGALDFMAAQANLSPEQQYEELQRNYHIYAEATANIARNWDAMQADGRTNMRSLFAAEAHRQKRTKGMEVPPEIKDPEQQSIYDKNIYNLFEAFKDDPAQTIRVSAAAQMYEADVKKYRKSDLDVGPYIEFAKELKWADQK